MMSEKQGTGEIGPQQHNTYEKMMGFSGLVGVFDCVVVCWAMFCFRRKKGRKLKSRISEW
jgi:hypothetical protein